MSKSKTARYDDCFIADCVARVRRRNLKVIGRGVLPTGIDAEFKDWTAEELIQLADRGHLAAGRALADMAVHQLFEFFPPDGRHRREMSPAIAAWVVELLNRTLSNDRLAKNLLAPKPRRGRRPAHADDLAVTDALERWKAAVVAFVELRRIDPRQTDTKMYAVFQDVANEASTWRWPKGLNPPTWSIVQKWYYEDRRSRRTAPRRRRGRFRN